MAQNAIPHLLASVAAKQPDNIAVTFFRKGKIETELTYSQLLRDINAFALFLSGAGIRKSDRVILLIEKSLLAVVAHFAILRLGAIAVPLNPGFKPSELDYLLHDADAKLIITDLEKEEFIRAIDPTIRIVAVSAQQAYGEIDFFRDCRTSLPEIKIRPIDPGLIIYTSGTTGNPKGAVLTHGNLIHDARNIIDIWRISQADILCHALPLFHIHGLSFALHTALLSGAQVRMLDRFTSETVLGLLSGKPDGPACTVFMAVPTMYSKLMDDLGDQPQQLKSLRLLTSGSAPLPVKEFQRIERLFGLRPVEREGMSETGMNFSNPLDGEQKPGSIGLPLPDLDVRIVNPETLKDVTAGEIGEFWLKSPAITPGYWRKPRETADAFMDGWFRTGDLGHVDRDGYYYLTDRMKHIIITGGENVSAKEVETVINAIEGVVESSVVGIPDDKWGEKVVAAVAAKPGSRLTVIEIQSVCKARLHDWKCPKEIKFVTGIPKNTMGKMRKDVVKRFFCETINSGTL